MKNDRPETKEYQTRIGDMLNFVLPIAEKRSSKDALLELKNQVDQYPELSAYMAEHNNAAWIMLLYTLDKFNSPTRFISIMSEVLGVDIGREKMRTEIGHIEGMAVTQSIKDVMTKM